MRRAAVSLATLWAVATSVAVLTAADTPEAPGAVPTFTKDVAPILYKNCVSCHRPGEIGPMALISYQEVRPWAKGIVAQVAARQMPPWGADPHYGTFKNDRSLSQKEIDTIVRWVNGGAPKGNDADLPAVPDFASGWTRGDPDVVLEMPVDFDVPAEGQVDVTDFYLEVPFTEDVYVKAVEIRPGVPQAVHHAGVYVIDRMPPGATLVNGRILSADGKQMSRSDIARANGRSMREENDKLLSFVPGRGYEEYQAGAGQRIKAGSYINFYMHYQPTGKPEKDRTKVGLYLAKPGQEVTHQIYHSLGDAGPTSYIVEGKQQPPLKSDDDLPPIPPYVDGFKVVSVHAITEPVTLYGMTPHLHLRGKSMTYTLVWPDGREEILLSVPRYDFNWQVYYELETPKQIPAGSKVVVTTLFDNSPNNKYNPAPQNTVYWSEQSWDEMYAPQVRITLDQRDLRKTRDLTLTPNQRRR
jgi:mono/diheme cytochrome c family protein